MEEEKMTEGEEDWVKAMKVLVGTSTVPLKVAVDVVGSIAESVEDCIPKPSKLASDLIDARVTALKAISKIVDKEVELLEKYKGDLEVSGGAAKLSVGLVGASPTTAILSLAV